MCITAAHVTVYFDLLLLGEAQGLRVVEEPVNDATVVAVRVAAGR